MVAVETVYQLSDDKMSPSSLFLGSFVRSFGFAETPTARRPGVNVGLWNALGLA